MQLSFFFNPARKNKNDITDKTLVKIKKKVQ